MKKLPPATAELVRIEVCRHFADILAKSLTIQDIARHLQCQRNRDAAGIGAPSQFNLTLQSELQMNDQSAMPKSEQTEKAKWQAIFRRVRHV